MKVVQLNNSSCGVEVTDIDLSHASESEVLEIGRLSAEHMLLVVRDQSLSPEREVEICQTIGNIECVPPDYYHRCPVSSAGQVVAGIQRVTGLKHPDGKPMGLFGHDHDLDWHANRPSADKVRKPLIWLYSDFGSAGSRTSWANCAAAYEDLDSKTKNEINDLHGIYGFEQGRYTTVDHFSSHRNMDGIPFIQTNSFNKKRGMYFPFLQLFGFKNRSEEYSNSLIERLRTHVLQSKYIYHHDWQDGDVTISEQWMTIHKRWACDVSNRMLHRISFDYDRVRSSFKAKPSLFQ